MPLLQGHGTRPISQWLDGASDGSQTGIPLAHTSFAGAYSSFLCGCPSCADKMDASLQDGSGFRSPLGKAEADAAQRFGADLPQFLGDDIGDDTGSNTTIAVGGSLSSSIQHGGDLDYIRVSLVAGQTYAFSLIGGTLPDAYVELRTASGLLVAENDDGGILLNSYLMYRPTQTGDFFIVARGFDASQTGSYTLAVNTIQTGNSSPTTFSDNGHEQFDTQFSWEEAAIQISRTGASWASAFNSEAVITYAFRSSAPVDMPDDTGGFSRFSAAQIAAAEAALAAWAAVANITFVRVNDGSGYSNNATILFANYSTGAEGAAAFAFLPSSGDASSASVQGDVWTNVSIPENANPVIGEYGQQILMHEIGHALGLSHPGAYNAGPDVEIEYQTHAEYFNDSRMFAVMSYFGSTNTGGNLPTFASLPQLHDIAAIQRLYGANMASRAGDTVYGFNSNTGVPQYTISLASQGAVFAIWDGGGLDTLDLSGYATNSTIDLRPEAFSSAGPGSPGPAVFNISIARGVMIENGIGGSGNDTLIGNSAANNLNGGVGADAMIGGAGSDTYIVDNVGDSVSEGSASGGGDTVQSSITYTLNANVENLTLTGVAAINGSGNSLNNVIAGNSAANALFGNGGNDTLDGGAGADALVGNFGNDTYIVDNTGDTVSEGSASGGVDTVQSSITYTLNANVENLTLTGVAAINGSGNSLNNVIAGNSAANALFGNDGNDTLDGGAGADALVGNFGNDTYIVDNTGDTVSEGSALGGTDHVFASVSFNLASTGLAENLTLTGSAAINGTGNALNNTLIGNTGANILTGNLGNDTLVGNDGSDTLYGGDGVDLLDGGAGADSMTGNFGNDTYIVDNTGDTVSEGSASGGVDTVQSSIAYTLNANVENLTLTGVAAINGSGNSLNNVIAGNSAANALFGNDGNDTLDGGAGADALVGNFGNDTYIVDNTGDTVSEGSALGGTDHVFASVSFNLASTGLAENLTLTGSAAINGTGNALNNTISGNDADNALNGAAGADTLDGGLGADALTGGAGADVFAFSSALGGENVDMLADFTPADDAIWLDVTVFGGLAAGMLDFAAFVIGATAADSDDRIIYDGASGALYFDADGAGGAEQVLFATLAAGLSLTNDDFFGF